MGEVNTKSVTVCYCLFMKYISLFKHLTKGKISVKVITCLFLTFFFLHIHTYTFFSFF